MLFKEKRNLIKADKPLDSQHIRNFNIENRSGYSFFLLTDVWDKFTKWMNTNFPKEILVLEYKEEQDG